MNILTIILDYILGFPLCYEVQNMHLSDFCSRLVSEIAV